MDGRNAGRRWFLAIVAAVPAALVILLAQPVAAQSNCGLVTGAICGTALADQGCPEDDRVCMSSNSLDAARTCFCAARCNAQTDCTADRQCTEGRCVTIACNSNADCASSFACTEGVCTRQSTPPPACTSDAQCTDGNACNGRETCDTRAGRCVPGAPVVCEQPASGLVSCRSLGPDSHECVADRPSRCQPFKVTGATLRMGPIGKDAGRRGFQWTGVIEHAKFDLSGSPGNLRINLAAKDAGWMVRASLADRTKTDADGWKRGPGAGVWRWQRQGPAGAIDSVTLTRGSRGGILVDVRGQATTNGQERMRGSRLDFTYVTEVALDWIGPDTVSTCGKVIAPVCAPYDSGSGTGMVCRERPVRSP